MNHSAILERKDHVGNISRKCGKVFNSNVSRMNLEAPDLLTKISVPITVAP